MLGSQFYLLVLLLLRFFGLLLFPLELLFLLPLLAGLNFLGHLGLLLGHLEVPLFLLLLLTGLSLDSSCEE
jgi:hypothetical protein